jgi:predicted peptidase
MRSLLFLVGALLVVGCGDDAEGSGGQGGSSPTTTSGAPASGPSTTTTGGPSSTSSSGMTSTATTGTGLPGGPSSDRLTLWPIGTKPGAPLGYAEYLPPGYGDGGLRPLLVFHHGIGESGNGSEEELDRLFNTGLPTLIENDSWPEERPFVVLMTQHDAPPFTSCHTVEEIRTFLEFAMGEYQVDPARIYITGLSCGAIGSWNYLGAHTDELVAGAVLIAGNGNPAFGQAGCELGKVPIWAFHGDADDTVDPSGSSGPINDLNECTSPAPVEAKLTIYPDVGHNSWDQTYDGSAGHDIYAWLLGHTKP